MLFKVFLVCALAVCFAQAHKNDVREEYDKTNSLFDLRKTFVKYPYKDDKKYDEMYQKIEHEYPYHHQYFLQHPYLHQYWNKYYERIPYIHPLNYVRGQDLMDRYNLETYHPLYRKYQQWNKKDVEDKYNDYYHLIQDTYYPHKVDLIRPIRHYQQEYIHPFLNRIFGHVYPHYPVYDI